MGLPSGNRWAVSNLDVSGPYYFQESPFQYECSFFSWGNTTPHNPISDSAFEYGWGTSVTGPYSSTPGAALTGNIPLSHDAARVLLGVPWRMPTTEDFAELFANIDYVQADGTTVIDASTTDKIVTVDGITGIYLRSRVNGSLLFFPCSGYGNAQAWTRRGTNGDFWSSSLYSATEGRRLNFGTNFLNPQDAYARFRGFAVRPVWNPRDLR